MGQLREEFRRYIRTKVAQELVDFYLDSLDREEVTGFFERQVKSLIRPTAAAVCGMLCFGASVVLAGIMLWSCEGFDRTEPIGRTRVRSHDRVRDKAPRRAPR